MAEPGVDIILAGGDDIIIHLHDESAASKIIECTRKAYSGECGRSMSVGVGNDSREAVINLRQAKLMRGNRIVGINGESGGTE